MAFSVCPDGVPCNGRCHAMPATMHSVVSSGLCPIFLETCLHLLSPLPSVYPQVGWPSSEILGSRRVLDLGIFRLEHLSGSDPWGWHWGKDEFSCVIEHSFLCHVNTHSLEGNFLIISNRLMTWNPPLEAIMSTRKEFQILRHLRFQIFFLI